MTLLFITTCTMPPFGTSKKFPRHCFFEFLLLIKEPDVVRNYISQADDNNLLSTSVYLQLKGCLEIYKSLLTSKSKVIDEPLMRLVAHGVGGNSPQLFSAGFVEPDHVRDVIFVHSTSFSTTTSRLLQLEVTRTYRILGCAVPRKFNNILICNQKY